MANTHNQFQEFLGTIRLNKTQKGKIVSARDGVRQRIKDYFQEKEEKQPNFFQQGSFSFKTTNNPLDGEFDIDDGVYLQNLPTDKSEWPKTETVHQWILDAVEDHTTEQASDKQKCVRVKYAGNYHVDLPIYSESDGQFFLAVKGDTQWEESDPKALNTWFYEHLDLHGEQMRKIILYLKASTDYNNIGNLKGIAITILVANNFETNEDRDDISFFYTIKKIRSAIQDNPVVKMPVEPFDDLFARLSESQIDAIIDFLKNIESKCEIAVSKEKLPDSSEVWTKVFGPRFPIVKEKKESQTSSFGLGSVGIIQSPPRPFYKD